MNFNEHSALVGEHAFLSASKYHWINYTDEKLVQNYTNMQAARMGDKLHDFARRAIELGIKLPRTSKTLNLFVNDALGYRMSPEQVLFYSINCFGTADAISFQNEKLRVHDLKTGVTPVSMNQLLVYTAIFCLEYKVKPGAISIELRIYQNDEIQYHEPTVDEVAHVMDKIITFDKRIEQLKKEAV